MNRSLRRQIAEEVQKFKYLRSYELEILDKISLIEVTFHWSWCTLRCFAIDFYSSFQADMGVVYLSGRGFTLVVIFGEHMLPEERTEEKF